MAIEALPDELLSLIIKNIASDTRITPRATRAGLQCTLETGDLNSFSLICSRFRRLSLPTFFRFVRISLGFLAPNTVTMEVPVSALEKFRDALRLNRRFCRFVREMTIVGGRGRFAPFVLDVLNTFVTLERLDLPAVVWNEAEIMNTIDNHPTLKEVYLPGKGWENEPVPHFSLRKVTWKTFFLNDSAETCHHLPSFFEAGLTVWDVTVIRDDFDWMSVVFRGMTKLMIDGERFTLDQRNKWLEFVDMQPALIDMKIMQPSPECFAFPRTTWLRTLLEERIEVLAVSECQLVRTRGEWLLTRLESTIEVENSDEYEEIAQTMLLGADSLDVLELTATQDFESRKSFEDFFRASFPALPFKMKECTIILPHAYARQAAVEAAVRLGLPAFPIPDYVDLAKKELLRLTYDLLLPCPHFKAMTYDLPNAIHNPSVSSGGQSMHIVPVWDGMSLKVHRADAEYKIDSGVVERFFIVVDEYWQPPQDDNT